CLPFTHRLPPPSTLFPYTTLFRSFTHPVDAPFMVIATQNPIEQAGTYRLPEAQLDRFLLKASIGYPDHAATVRILEGSDVRAHDTVIPAVIDADEVVALAALVRSVHVDPSINDYVSRLVEATRSARSEERRAGHVTGVQTCALPISASC